ncbi:hypothetical protein NMG29_05080 [Streptomyces cocklensis]|jgi:hypothetical protein|uniref:DUF7144 domain-containing protein n=1 Tax=Actinacidiphila cocklensis TaxID=887465 RepID=A0A9W4GSL8_9ACTN|nr:hypothetical protein [Actinacidiphila cocklensis]MDD1057603.1 hypothetical protein [Actinacidiphila cocklensis]CAG6393765.1 conserved membrane hypothetical protein [Actinacidiphila cocklensis]
MSHDTPSPQPPPAGPGRSRNDDERNSWAAGGTVFAGVLLLVAGVLAILEGIVGIARDTVYIVNRGGYVYDFNVRAWGWIHLVLGVIAVIVGAGLLRGDAWAKYLGIAIAGLSMIANFMFLPYQPVWSLIMIGIDIFVIWALATYHPQHGRQAGGKL